MFYLKNLEEIKGNTADSKYSALYIQLRTDSIDTLLLNNLMMIRRLVYGVNIVYLYDSPFIQVAINSTISCAYVHFLIVYKPYKTKWDNMMNLFIEGNIFLILTLIGVFIHQNLPSEIYQITEVSLVVLLYMSTSVVTIINFILDVKKAINMLKAKCTKQQQIEISTMRPE